MADLFDGILGQPSVRRFLRATVESGRIGQAYLFVGPAGSNKTLAAHALAQAIVCENGGCGTCDACERVRRRRHPDVRLFEPQGAGGYLVEQVRDIVADVDLAPIQAKRKVYILDRVDLLGVQGANAFLKTLEEPPAHVHLILLGRTREAVLPTIVSRCQVVPFRHIPQTEAAGIVSQNAGVDAQRAIVSIEACGGSISRAIEFARSAERYEFRIRVLEVMEALELADDLDVLGFAAELLDRAKAPLDAIRTAQEADLARSQELLAAAAVKQIEARNKRQLTAKAAESIAQITAIARSWLRDVMAVCAGTPELVINADRAAGIQAAAAHTNVEAACRALMRTDEADRAFRYNVSPETCIDVLLLQMREELYGSHSARGVAI